jgi:hypothetical protein
MRAGARRRIIVIVIVMAAVAGLPGAGAGLVGASVHARRACGAERIDFFVLLSAVRVAPAVVVADLAVLRVLVVAAPLRTVAGAEVLILIDIAHLSQHKHD